MENLKIHSELVSLEEQLEILKVARECLIENARRYYLVKGLCSCIGSNLLLSLQYLIEKSYDGLSQIIPLFTKDNAIEYCGGKYGAYWWPRYTSDGKCNLAPRLAMLDWMEGLIKEEIDKQK